MDILQKQHAFDQIEMHLQDVKKAFIEQAEQERDEEIDDLKHKIDELQGDLEKEEELSRQYKDSLDEIRKCCDNVDYTSDAASLQECIDDIKSYL